MEIQPKLSSSEIELLRERWLTQTGRDVVRQLVAIWHADSRGWRSLTDQLPGVGIPAPYPELLTDLRGLELKQVKLIGAQLPYVDLSYASLKGCNLEGVCLQGSKLSWASFEGSNLKNSDLLQVMADHALFDKCSLNRAVLDVGDFRYASFQGAQLPQVMMDGADLTDAQLSGAILKGVKAIGTRFPADFDRQRLFSRPKPIGPSGP